MKPSSSSRNGVQRQRIAFALLTLTITTLLILSCAWGQAPLNGVTATSAPRWACPSPEPAPFGAAGPVKEYETCNCSTDPVTGDESCEQCPIYYEEWEQEYGHLGGPPFPAPTPYGRTGTSFRLGERVEIGPVHALIDADAGSLVTAPGVAPNTQQLYRITITWTSAATTELPIDYGRQVRLSAITGANGGVQTDTTWGVTGRALELANLQTLPQSIPQGTSKVVVPVIAPPGTPKTVDLLIPAQIAGGDIDAELQAENDHGLVPITWSAGELAGPACSDPGALTPWASGAGNPLAVAAPPGAARVVQVAMAQVGLPYVWGAKGPNAFDCSGLMTWSYGQIGITIPQGTSGQWPGLPPVDQGALKPGDMVYMDTNDPVRGEITHVGMLVGDINGNGQWDMVHAASPALGVRIDYDIFTSAYYSHRLLGFRTVR